MEETPGTRHELRTDHHPRRLGAFEYVYAVLSRRAAGISIGLNLCPDKSCSFACVYCQVDRNEPASCAKLDGARLLAELDALLRAAQEGRLQDHLALEQAPPSARHLADIAFSGDGEPTAYPDFARVLRAVGELRDRHVPGTPITLITNASTFHLDAVREGLDLLAALGGRVWAKLDAGTPEGFRRVNRSAQPFERILANIRAEARRRPLVIQSLFFAYEGRPPAPRELDAWAERLREIVDAGGQIAAVQVTTVARRPAEASVRALGAEELEEIAERARARLPGVPVETFPSGAKGAGAGGASAPRDEEE